MYFIALFSFLNASLENISEALLENCLKSLSKSLEHALILKNPYTIVVAQTYKSCNYPNLPSLLRYFLTQSGCEKSPEMACLAVAGPVAQGRAVLTNLCWEISESQLIDELGCKQARLINDVLLKARARVIRAVLGRPIGPTPVLARNVHW